MECNRKMKLRDVVGRWFMVWQVETLLRMAFATFNPRGGPNAFVSISFVCLQYHDLIYAPSAINPRSRENPYCCTSRAAIDSETMHPKSNRYAKTLHKVYTVAFAHRSLVQIFRTCLANTESPSSSNDSIIRSHGELFSPAESRSS
jgi:hypothetical protein